MDTILSSAQGVLETILKMPVILTFAFALCAVGWFLERIQKFPNTWIPAFYLIASGFTMLFLLPVTPPGQVDPHLAHPEVADCIRRIGVGILVGMVSWGGQKPLFMAVGKVFPALAPPPPPQNPPTPPTPTLMLLLCLSLLTGCTTAYKTLYTVGHGTDAAVKSYYDLVVTGRVPTNGVPAVGAAYKNFQLAYGAAVTLAQHNPKARADTNVLARSAAVSAAIAAGKVGGR